MTEAVFYIFAACAVVTASMCILSRSAMSADELKAALERQQFVQARLGQLRQRLSKLSQIDVSQIPPDKVGLGSLVMVEDENTGERESYSLVFGDSVEYEEGQVTMSSPIMPSGSTKSSGPS